MGGNGGKKVTNTGKKINSVFNLQLTTLIITPFSPFKSGLVPVGAHLIEGVLLKYVKMVKCEKIAAFPKQKIFRTK
jgi:hypothetical protein